MQCDANTNVRWNDGDYGNEESDHEQESDVSQRIERRRFPVDWATDAGAFDRIFAPAEERWNGHKESENPHR